MQSSLFFFCFELRCLLILSVFFFLRFFFIYFFAWERRVAFCDNRLYLKVSFNWIFVGFILSKWTWPPLFRTFAVFFKVMFENWVLVAIFIVRVLFFGNSWQTLRQSCYWQKLLFSFEGDCHFSCNIRRRCFFASLRLALTRDRGFWVTYGDRIVTNRITTHIYFS